MPHSLLQNVADDTYTRLYHLVSGTYTLIIIDILLWAHSIIESSSIIIHYHSDGPVLANFPVMLPKQPAQRTKHHQEVGLRVEAAVDLQSPTLVH